MFISHHIQTAYGPSRIHTGRMIRTTLTGHELHALARLIDREADEAEAEGRYETAGTLATRATALREAAR